MKLFRSPQSTTTTTTCARCGKEIGLLGKLDFNKKTGRCGKCESENHRLLNRFRDAFLTFCQDGILSQQEWTTLVQNAEKDGVALDEALTFARGDAVQLLERTLAIAAADGAITDEEERDLVQLQTMLQVPNDMVKPILARLDYLKGITRIRRGELPTVKTAVRLESDEVCHLETDAQYHKVNAKSVTTVPGRLVATNKKLHFLSPSGGAEIGYKTIKRIDQQSGGVYLELSKKTNNGFYRVADPLMTEAVLDTLVRVANRELIQTGETATRHIPHDVKIAVWQRDQGMCTQCKATSYLEFDHIIPFSKGGANTENNIQLLCRKCNLEKGDRI